MCDCSVCVYVRACVREIVRNALFADCSNVYVYSKCYVLKWILNMCALKYV